VNEQAKHLEAIWIERERKQRRQIDPTDQTATIGTAASEATKQCRLDLQHAFRLVSIRDRLGPGPMTDAEAAEYARQECESAKRIGEAAQALGRLGGLATSEAKAKAARLNAKKGGWPKGRPRKASKMNPTPCPPTK
jgi:hypothetical protein